jgi:hypothetical protein
MSERSGIIQLPFTKKIREIPSLLFEKLKLIAVTIQKWSQIRPVRIILQVLILTFSILYLRKSFQSVDQFLLGLSLETINLVWAFVITLGALFLGGLGWWLTLLSVGQFFHLRDAIRIHSSLIWLNIYQVCLAVIEQRISDAEDGCTNKANWNSHDAGIGPDIYEWNFGDSLILSK